MNKINKLGKVNIYHAAFQDFITSFTYWRIFCVMGINDIRTRYIRSRIGQFWITIALSLNICTLGIVWTYLFKMPAREYIPFLSVGTIFWTFLSTCITEGANIFISSASFIKELNIPKLSYINGLFVRNLIILFHNLIVLIPIYLIFSLPLYLSAMLYSFFGFFLMILFLFPIVVFVGILSLRFRDFVNIITSFVQMIFYITPVMWKISFMPESIHKYMILNPLTVFLSITRDPLLFTEVPREYYLAAYIYILTAWFITSFFFVNYRSRIAYWV